MLRVPAGTAVRLWNQVLVDLQSDAVRGRGRAAAHEYVAHGFDLVEASQGVALERTPRAVRRGAGEEKSSVKRFS